MENSQMMEQKKTFSLSGLLTFRKFNKKKKHFIKQCSQGVSRNKFAHYPSSLEILPHKTLFLGPYLSVERKQEKE